MKLTARQRYDYRDATRAELLLTRAGHHVWAQVKSLRAKSGDTDAQRLALYAALEIVWEAKRASERRLKRRGPKGLRLGIRDASPATHGWRRKRHRRREYRYQEHGKARRQEAR